MHLRIWFALACLVPLASADAGWAPAAAAALDLPDARALVAWVPGAGAADSYRVYGALPGGGLARLGEAPADAEASLVVPGGYAAYAVAGVRGGVESGLVYAAGPSCVTIDQDPPGVGVGLGCITGHAGKVRAVVQG